MKYYSYLIRSIILLQVIGVAVLFISCKESSSLVAPVENPGWFGKVDSLVTQTMVQGGYPGAVVGIFEHDAPIAVYAKGYSNIASLTKMKADLKFRIASNTKTFAAQTVILLAQDKLIDLDKHLIDYLPYCGIQYADIITVRQLLNMTSGIASYNEQPQFVDVWNASPLIPWTKDAILSIIKTATPDFYPGTNGHYSDSNYFLLGLIIEVVTNHTAETEITNRILIPLGLNNTSFPVTPDMPDNYCSGYKLDSNNVLIDCSRITPTGPWTGGAMISNVYDLGKWMKVLGTGSLLSEDMKALCFNWVKIDGGTAYGLGVLKAVGLIGHTGLIQGFESIMLYSPVKDASVIVMFNKGNENIHGIGSASLCVGIFRIIYPGGF